MYTLALEIIKIPRRRILCSRAEPDRQGPCAAGMLRTLDWLIPAMLSEKQATGII